MNKIKVQIYTYEFEFVPNKDYSLREITDSLNEWLGTVSQPDRFSIYLINDSEKEGYPCEGKLNNQDYFHVSEKIYNFAGKFLCGNCVRRILREDSNEDTEDPDSKQN